MEQRGLDMGRKLFRHVGRHQQIRRLPRPRRAVGRRAAGQHGKNRRRHPVYVGCGGVALLELILLRSRVSRHQLRFEVRPDHMCLGYQKILEMRAAIRTQQDILRADPQMIDPRRMDGGQGGEQRHEKRPRLVPAHPAAGLA